MNRRSLNLLTWTGIWVGILLLLSPLLMWAVGRAGQWRMQQVWNQERETVSPATSLIPRGPAASGKQAAHERSGLDRLPPGGDALRPVKLLIPRIHLDAVVVDGVSPSNLAEGPGFFPGSANPGGEGNCAIAAHRNVWGSWFEDLNRLRAGDPVVLETPRSRFTYRVRSMEIVSPREIGVLDDEGSQRILTLITCTHPATRRIVIRARLAAAVPVT